MLMDAAHCAETRAKVQEGLADIDSGDVLDADEVHAELEKKFGIVIRVHPTIDKSI